MDLEGKVIVITGATRGLGEKMAEAVSAEGTKSVEACAKSGTKVKGYGADVADDQAVAALFNDIEKHFGGIGGLSRSAVAEAARHLAEGIRQGAQGAVKQATTGTGLQERTEPRRA